MTQNEIILGCRAGREDAYRYLVNTYASRLMGICVRYLRDHQKAEDAVQETFIQVFKSVHRFDTSGVLIAWMTKIAINNCLKELRKNKRLVFSGDELEFEHLPEMPTIEQQLSVDDILKTLDTLPPAYRIVFNLYVVEGYSHKEISDLLDIRESASRTKLSRARKMVHDYLTAQAKKSIV